MALSPVALVAQSRAGAAPPEARALIVRIDSRFEEQHDDYGAGVIVGADDSLVYIATAKHVTRNQGWELLGLTVTFAPPYSDTAQARVLPHERDELDLAVIVVPRHRSGAIEAAIGSFDRLGDPRRLGALAPVYPVGCPQSECWRIPVPANIALTIDRMGISFQSSFVQGGSSGGGLFNAQWEVVGLVTESVPPRANALPIDEVLGQLQQWKVPVGLRQRAIPRAGYATVVSATLLMPMGAGESFADRDRLPSGRLTVARRTRSVLSWHASVTRLAPADLGVTAGTVGAALSYSAGRLTMQPFGEVGLARVEGRFDGGGYELADGTHVPVWQAASEDGLVFGAGLELQLVLIPRVILGVMAGHWSVSSPPGTPSVPGMFIGTGLRLGLDR